MFKQEKCYHKEMVITNPPTNADLHHHRICPTFFQAKTVLMPRTSCTLYLIIPLVCKLKDVELLKRAVQELLEDTLKTLCFSCLLILKAIGTPT
jgi:hypothetical protein